MSAFINEVTIMGNLGRKPELRYFANGTANLRVSLATTEKWTDKETGEIHTATEWHSVLLRGGQAERVAEYMDAGDKLWIRGKIKARHYTDANGIERVISEVHAKEMKIINTRNRKKTNDYPVHPEDIDNVEEPEDDPLESFM